MIGTIFHHQWEYYLEFFPLLHKFVFSSSTFNILLGTDFLTDNAKSKTCLRMINGKRATCKTLANDGFSTAFHRNQDWSSCMLRSYTLSFSFRKPSNAKVGSSRHKTATLKKVSNSLEPTTTLILRVNTCKTLSAKPIDQLLIMAHYQ